jgi:hypothetical protein
MPRDAAATLRPAWPGFRARRALVAALLVGLAAPAAADLRTPTLPAAAPEAGYALHADADFGSVYALFDQRRGAVVGFRHVRNAPGIGSYHHRWLFGLEYRHADSLVPNVTFHPVSVGYAAGWNGTGRSLDGSLAFHRNLPGGRDGDSAAMEAARSGAKAGYSIVRYNATFLQALPAAWRMKLVAEGQYSPPALVSCEQFALGGRDSMRGLDERALAGDRGRRLTVELQTPDFGTLLRPRLSALGLLFLDQGSVSRNQTLPGESGQRTQAASIGFGVAMSLARAWQLRAELAHLRQSGPGEADTLDHERGQLSVTWTP